MTVDVDYQKLVDSIKKLIEEREDTFNIFCF